MRPSSRTARLMVLPAAVLLLVLVGMALAASPEPERDRANNNSSQTSQAQTDQRPLADELDDSPDNLADAPSVTIDSDNGEVEVHFGPDGVIRVSAEDGTELDLIPGRESGLRLGEDGQLEPVPPAVMEEGDLGLTATDHGIELQTPDGLPIELRPDGVSGGVSATEIDGDVATPLTPDDGIVELPDGTTISPIEESGDTIQTLGPPPPMPWTWIFSIIAAIAVISAVVGHVLHRNYQESDLRVAQTPTAARFDEDFEQFLARLAADESPTRAVRLGFHAVENGLGGLPSRRQDETPFEWHQRVGTTMPTMDEPVGRICDLFARARFAPGTASEDDRQQMIAEIRTVVTGAHTPSPTEIVV